MKFLVAILDALVAFVQRNPLFVLCVVVLALVAPSLLKGVAAFVLYMFVGFFLLIGILGLLFRWRIYRVQREVEKQFGRGAGAPFGGAERRSREGDVRVHRTGGAPEKRISGDVGDYVEFEETKDEQA